MLKLFPLFIFTLTTLALAAQAPATLPLEGYLQQVRIQNTGYRGAVTGALGANETSEEGKLLVLPRVFADAALSSDSKLPTFPILAYDRYDYDTYDLGVSELTTFGLQAKLFYSVAYNHYKNLFTGTGTSDVSFYDASPAIQLTQDFWSNGFGRSTRAQQDLLEAQSLANSYNSSFQAKSILTDAELSYWSLSLSRQYLGIQRDAEDRAQKIYDWNVRRANLHLGDQADALQALAALESRKLLVQTAVDNLRNSSRAFNTDRNVDSDDVPEKLTQATFEIARDLKIPDRVAMREDVKAAQQNARAQQASAIISSEKDRPTLQAFASFALNGRNTSSSATLNNSFDSGRPTESAGVHFSAPLDFGLVKKSRDGWDKQSQGADLTFQKSVFNENESWVDLNKRFAEAKGRLELSREIEAVQERKLNYEKDRLKKGRTTTFQVLQFEQDYSLSEAARVQAEQDVFTYYSQLKLFGETL